MHSAICMYRCNHLQIVIFHPPLKSCALFVRGGNPSVAGIVTRVVWFSRFLVLWGSRIRGLLKATWLVNCFHPPRDIFSPILMNDKRGMLTEKKNRALVHLSAEKGVEFSLTRWTTTHDSRDRFTEVAQNCSFVNALSLLPARVISSKRSCQFAFRLLLLVFSCLPSQHLYCRPILRWTWGKVTSVRMATIGLMQASRHLPITPPPDQAPARSTTRQRCFASWWQALSSCRDVWRDLRLLVHASGGDVMSLIFCQGITPSWTLLYHLFMRYISGWNLWICWGCWGSSQTTLDLCWSSGLTSSFSSPHWTLLFGNWSPLQTTMWPTLWPTSKPERSQYSQQWLQKFSSAPTKGGPNVFVC